MSSTTFHQNSNQIIIIPVLSHNQQMTVAPAQAAHPENTHHAAAAQMAQTARTNLHLQTEIVTVKDQLSRMEESLDNKLAILQRQLTEQNERMATLVSEALNSFRVAEAVNRRSDSLKLDSLYKSEDGFE